eukprot:1221328-Rhodomonas_salina.1
MRLWPRGERTSTERERACVDQIQRGAKSLQIALPWTIGRKSKMKVKDLLCPFLIGQFTEKSVCPTAGACGISRTISPLFEIRVEPGSTVRDCTGIGAAMPAPVTE